MTRSIVLYNSLTGSTKKIAEVIHHGRVAPESRVISLLWLKRTRGAWKGTI